MPSFDMVITTGEAQFLVESLFPAHAGKFRGHFVPEGSYAVRARIEVADDELAGVLQQAIARMRHDRLGLDRIARLTPADTRLMPPEEQTE